MINKRILLAKKLLRKTNSSIIEISNSVGYNDALYFSRIFKKKEGISPLAYRKQQE
jgi:YesN/AraC family two-component response regulator